MKYQLNFIILFFLISDETMVVDKQTDINNNTAINPDSDSNLFDLNTLYKRSLMK